MKKTIFFLTFLLALLTVCYAQNNPILEHLKAQRSEMGRTVQKSAMKKAIRSVFQESNRGLLMSQIADYPEFAEAMDFSEEQKQQMQDRQTKFQKTLQQHPEFQKILADMQENKDPIAAREKLSDLAISVMSSENEKILTQEQIKRFDEFRLASKDMPNINVNAFEPLGLSDAQRAEMKKISKEHEQEFESLNDDLTEISLVFSDKVMDAMLLRSDEIKTVEDVQKMTKEIAEKLKEDPEAMKLALEMQGKMDGFIKRVKFKLYDVLTDEQMDKLTNLTDNPPEYLKKLLGRLKKTREDMEKSGDWQPSINSWKPGDPIPEEYKKKRQERKSGGFPTGEN